MKTVSFFPIIVVGVFKFNYKKAIFAKAIHVVSQQNLRVEVDM